MTENREQEFLQAARTELDRSARELDELTVARLRAARLQAVAARPRRRWLAAAGLGAGALAAGVVAFLLVATPAAPPVTGLEQLELLSENDALDLYKDLEFYRWLAEGTHAG